MPKFTEMEVPHKQLLLDPNNYRFRNDPDYQTVAERRFAEESVQRTARLRLREEALIELKRSILSNGFLPVERIVVRRSDVLKDYFVVLEGNRRVAALKWISEDHDGGIEVPAEVLSVVKKIPVLVLEEAGKDRGLYEAIMGIRHVSGIKEWGGYQRAQLIKAMRDEHGLEPQIVAERLAMNVREVNRRYKAYMALEQMSDIDDVAEHATAKLYPLFHEAIALPKVKEWLGWEDDSNSFTNQDALAEFYNWITPHEEDGQVIEPKITNHREIRDLPLILADPEALAVLEDRSKNFSDAIAIAKREQVAKAWKGQVASATSALKSISVVELVDLSSQDLQLLKELQKSVDTTLTSFGKLTKK